MPTGVQAPGPSSSYRCRIDFGVRVRPEPVAAVATALRGAPVVVDFAVDDEDERAVLVVDRLGAAGDVDDAEAAMPSPTSSALEGPDTSGPRWRARSVMRSQQTVFSNSGETADPAHVRRNSPADHTDAAFQRHSRGPEVPWIDRGILSRIHSFQFVGDKVLRRTHMDRGEDFPTRRRFSHLDCRRRLGSCRARVDVLFSSNRMVRRNSQVQRLAAIDQYLHQQRLEPLRSRYGSRCLQSA